MICVCIASASVFQSASAFALHLHRHVHARLGSGSGGTSNIIIRTLGHFGWKVQCMHQADIEYILANIIDLMGKPTGGTRPIALMPIFVLSSIWIRIADTDSFTFFAWATCIAQTLSCLAIQWFLYSSTNIWTYSVQDFRPQLVNFLHFEKC